MNDVEHLPTSVAYICIFFPEYSAQVLCLFFLTELSITFLIMSIQIHALFIHKEFLN